MLNTTWHPIEGVDEGLREARYRLADDVCWRLLIMMHLGGLTAEPAWRDYLAESMQPWADAAHWTGDLQGEDNHKHNGKGPLAEEAAWDYWLQDRSKSLT